MTTIGICDDEACMLEDLKRRVAAYMDKMKVEYRIFSFTSAELLLRHERALDIVFLDIQMQGMDGMEAAKLLRAREQVSFLVFVTVSPDYIFDAFQAEASDYLLKPIEDVRLHGVLHRIFSRLFTDKNKFLTIKHGQWSSFVKFCDIYYAEAVGRKLCLYRKGGVLEYYGKIEELEAMLTEHFFRCHRSYLVNLRYVREQTNGVLALENGENLPLSRLRQQAFSEKMLDYMKRQGG